MKIRDLLILAGCLGAASHASALSLGASQGNVILGSPLDLSFQVRPDAGLSAEHSCITAAIRMGDNLVGDNAVNVLFNGSDSVRIRGRYPVNEPVVTIELSAGCEGAVRRSYTFFSDPPQEFTHSAAPLRLPAAPPVVSIPVDSPAVQKFAPRPAVSSQAASATRAQVTRPARAAAAPKPAPATTPAPKPVAAAPQTAAPVATAEPTAPAPQTPAPTSPEAPLPTPAPAPEATGESKPTLRMEALDGLGKPDAIGTPASAGSLTGASADGLPSSAVDNTLAMPSDTGSTAGPSLADPRMAQLEGMLERLLEQQQVDRQQVLALQTQLQQAQTPQELPAWVLAMMGLLGLSAGTILWLLHRVRTEKANSERWAQTVQTADAPAPVAPAPDAARATIPPAPPAPAAPAALSSGTVLPLSTPAPAAFASPAAGATLLTESTAALQPLESSRDFASVQEQADFFCSLGQHQQAVELLQNHVLQNSRTSPKGYLWLLKLLAEQNLHEAFGRTRANFEQHFNVVVPEFTAYHRKGRGLEAGYPETLEQVQAAWPHSDTLTLLRSLLTRAEHGPAAQRRFELQAFDELLALYDAAAHTPPAQRGALPLPVLAPVLASTAAPAAMDAADNAAALDMPASLGGAAAADMALPSAMATAAVAPSIDDLPRDLLDLSAPASTAFAPDLDLATFATPAAPTPASDSSVALDLSAFNTALLDDAPITMAPATPAVAPAATGASSWAKPAAPGFAEAALELPDLEMLSLDAGHTPSIAPLPSDAAASPFGGPQLSLPDDALLQSLQLDASDNPTAIASTPSTPVALSLNEGTMPMLDLNDFLSSSTLQAPSLDAAKPKTSD